MNVEIPQNQLEQLNALAAQTGKATDELVQEAVSKLLAYNDWFKAQAQTGVEQIQRGALTGQAWEQELDNLLADLPDTPALSDEAMKRENWYPDRR